MRFLSKFSLRVSRVPLFLGVWLSMVGLWGLEGKYLEALGVGFLGAICSVGHPKKCWWVAFSIAGLIVCRQAITLSNNRNDQIKLGLVNSSEKKGLEAEVLILPFEEKNYRVPVQVTAVNSRETWSKTRFKAFLNTSSPLVSGRIYRIQANWEQLDSPRNPGQFNFSNYWKRQGFLTQADLVGEAIDLGSTWREGYGKWNQRFKKSIQHRLTAGWKASSRESGLILAIFLGKKSAEIKTHLEPFKQLGVMHLFVVSGLHVGLLGLLLWKASMIIGMPRRPSILVVLLLLLVYAWLTEFRAPAVRALWMATCGLGAMWWYRKPSLLNALSLACLVSLLINPQQFFQIGFQLSYGVVAAIGFLSFPIARFLSPLYQPDPYLPRRYWSHYQRRFFKLGKTFSNVFCPSIAAWFGSLPWTLGVFHLWHPLSWLMTMLLAPCVAVSLGLGLVSLIPLPFGLDQKVAYLNGKSLGSLAKWVENFPKWAKWQFPVTLSNQEGLWIYDFSRGASSLVYQSSQGDTVLIDGARSSQWDSQVKPYRSFSNTQNYLFLSHADVGHIGGLMDLVESGRTKGVWGPNQGRSSAYKNLKKLAKQAESWRGSLQMKHLIEVGKNANVSCFWGTPHLAKGGKANQFISLYLLELFDWNVLCLSDLGFAEQFEWLQFQADKPLPSIDVVVLQGDGEDPVDIEALLTQVKPRVLILQRGSEQLRLEDWKKYCSQLDIILLDQAQLGAIHLNPKPSKLLIKNLSKQLCKLRK